MNHILQGLLLICVEVVAWHQLLLRAATTHLKGMTSFV
jgi:hypothetical protein